MIKQGQSGIQVDETSRTSGFQVTSSKEKEVKKHRWGVKDFYLQIIEAVNFKVKCDLGIGCFKFKFIHCCFTGLMAAQSTILVQTEISQKLFDKLPLN